MAVSSQSLWVVRFLWEGKIFYVPFHICPQVILRHGCSDEKTRVERQRVCFSLVSRARPWALLLDWRLHSAAMCRGLPWMRPLSRPGAGIRIWILFWQSFGKRKKEELRKTQLWGIHAFCFGAGSWRLCYLTPLGLTISEPLQASRNHSHSLWPSRKEADLFSSQSLGFSALTVGKLWLCHGLIKPLAFKLCSLSESEWLLNSLYPKVNNKMLGEALDFLIRKELHCRNAILSFFSPEKPVVTVVIHAAAIIVCAAGLCCEIWGSTAICAFPLLLSISPYRCQKILKHIWFHHFTISFAKVLQVESCRKL